MKGKLLLIFSVVFVLGILSVFVVSQVQAAVCCIGQDCIQGDQTQYKQCAAGAGDVKEGYDSCSPNPCLQAATQGQVNIIPGRNINTGIQTKRWPQCGNKGGFCFEKRCPSGYQEDANGNEDCYGLKCCYRAGTQVEAKGTFSVNNVPKPNILIVIEASLCDGTKVGKQEATTDANGNFSATFTVPSSRTCNTLKVTATDPITMTINTQYLNLEEEEEGEAPLVTVIIEEISKETAEALGLGVEEEEEREEKVEVSLTALVQLSKVFVSQGNLTISWYDPATGQDTVVAMSSEETNKEDQYPVYATAGDLQAVVDAMTTAVSENQDFTFKLTNERDQPAGRETLIIVDRIFETDTQGQTKIRRPEDLVYINALLFSIYSDVFKPPTQTFDQSPPLTMIAGTVMTFDGAPAVGYTVTAMQEKKTIGEDKTNKDAKFEIHVSPNYATDKTVLVKVTDSNGNPAANATVDLYGREYLTNSGGQIVLLTTDLEWLKGVKGSKGECSGGLCFSSCPKGWERTGSGSTSGCATEDFCCAPKAPKQTVGTASGSYTVSGQVTTSNDQPASGYTVAIIDNRNVVATFPVDSQGSFSTSFTVPPAAIESMSMKVTDSEGNPAKVRVDLYLPGTQTVAQTYQTNKQGETPTITLALFRQFTTPDVFARTTAGTAPWAPYAATTGISLAALALILMALQKWVVTLPSWLKAIPLWLKIAILTGGVVLSGAAGIADYLATTSDSGTSPTGADQTGLGAMFASGGAAKQVEEIQKIEGLIDEIIKGVGEVNEKAAQAREVAKDKKSNKADKNNAKSTLKTAFDAVEKNKKSLESKAKGLKKALPGLPKSDKKTRAIETINNLYTAYNALQTALKAEVKMAELALKDPKNIGRSEEASKKKKEALQDFKDAAKEFVDALKKLSGAYEE